MVKKRCIIIGASPDTDTEIIKKYLRKDDFIACADGGYVFACQLGITPSLIIGDFDSSSYPHTIDSKIISLPVRKDDTDTVCVVKECLKIGFDEFLFFGMTGGRFDHTMANISVLYSLAMQNKTAYIIDNKSKIGIMSSGLNIISDCVGYGFGIFPFACEKIELSLSGFKYELDHGTLTAGYPVGVSNTIISKTASIELFSGSAVFIINLPNH